MTWGMTNLGSGVCGGGTLTHSALSEDDPSPEFSTGAADVGSQVARPREGPTVGLPAETM